MSYGNDGVAAAARGFQSISPIPVSAAEDILCSWLHLIKLFELEVNARKASIQLGLSYTTTLKGFNILRKVILRELSRSDEVLRSKIEADESYFGEKRKRKIGRVVGEATVCGI